MNARLAFIPDTLPDGKRRLIASALKLAARDGSSLSSLGLRELARDADLNHNTFYRHFDDLSDLGRAAAEAVVTQVMIAMRKIRESAATHEDANIGAAEYFLDFARDNPELVVVGLRELHGRGSPMRVALQQALADIAHESTAQIVELDLAGGLTRESLMQLTADITYYMFYRALDYLEQPRRRRRVRDEIVAFIRAQFLGRLELQRVTVPR